MLKVGAKVFINNSKIMMFQVMDEESMLVVESMLTTDIMNG
jgi:hypothetical protein